MGYPLRVVVAGVFTAAALAVGLGGPANALPPVHAVASAPTPAVTQAPLQASTPVIKGTAKVGSTLKASAGAWTRGTSLTYQWSAGGKRVTGGTKSALVVAGDHVGKKITVTVTGQLSGYATESRTSKSTGTVVRGTLTSATPTISGSVRVGSTLIAKPGKWTAGTALSYRWYANGKTIGSATKAAYFVTAKLLGKKITVQVTGKKAGYTTVAKKSKTTAAVRAATWATKKYGSFTEKRITGFGDDVITLPSSAKSGIVVATHDGESNFIVESMTDDGEYVDLLVNEIGAYTGTTPFGMESWTKGKGRYLEVVADGEWEIRIRPMTMAPAMPSTGQGDGVFQYMAKATATRSITHTGESNFIVQNYRGSDWDLLVNEIGDYAGRKRVPAGPSIIVVTADGTWRFK